MSRAKHSLLFWYIVYHMKEILRTKEEVGGGLGEAHDTFHFK